MSTGLEIASSTFAKNCFWASNAVPVPIMHVRACACAPRIAQTYMRMESLILSTPGWVNPSDKCRPGVVGVWVVLRDKVHVERIVGCWFRERHFRVVMAAGADPSTDRHVPRVGRVQVDPPQPVGEPLRASLCGAKPQTRYRSVRTLADRMG